MRDQRREVRDERRKVIEEKEEVRARVKDKT